MTHNLTHDRKRAERNGYETAPENLRNCGTNGAERAEKARTDLRSEATDQKAGGSNPSWRAKAQRRPIGAALSFYNMLILRDSNGSGSE